MHGAAAWRWIKMSARDTEIISMPGTHDDILSESAAAFIAGQLKTRLEAVDSTSGKSA
jgi:hypothetical protein